MFSLDIIQIMITKHTNEYENIRLNLAACSNPFIPLKSSMVLDANITKAAIFLEFLFACVHVLLHLF